LAVQFLGDLRFCDTTPEDWKRLDEAPAGTPKTKTFPAETAATLFGRFEYARQNGWDSLARTSRSPQSATILKT